MAYIQKTKLMQKKKMLKTKKWLQNRWYLTSDKGAQGRRIAVLLKGHNPEQWP